MILYGSPGHPVCRGELLDRRRPKRDKSRVGAFFLISILVFLILLRVWGKPEPYESAIRTNLRILLSEGKTG